MVSTLGLFYSLTAHHLSLFAAAPKGGGGDEAAGLGFAFFCGYFILILAIAIPTIAGMWKTFEKAGQPGWAAIVPIYNIYVLSNEVAKKEPMWFILYVVGAVICGPVALVALFVINAAVAEKFRKGAGFGIGLTLLPFIFYPMLGFGSAQYAGKKKKYYDEYDDEEDEEEEERPRNRRRNEDDEEEEERPQPKRRRDEDEDERPRNRRRDDDDDDDDDRPPPPKKRRRDDD